MPEAVEFISAEDVEFGPVDKGEYLILIKKAEEKSGTKNGRDWANISCIAEIVGEDESDDIYPTIWPPSTDPNEDRKRRMKEEKYYREACEALGVDPSQAWDVEDLVGREVYVYLTVKDDGEYGKRNEVSRWIGAA